MKSLALAHRLLPVAVAYALLAGAGSTLRAAAASPADEVRAAVNLAAGSAEVKAMAPKIFLGAVSAVLAGTPAEQMAACAAAAAVLRPDLAEDIVHTAISALHLPGQLPDPALVAAVVKAVVTAAPDMVQGVVARATAAAPEARENILQAARTAAPAQFQLASAGAAVLNPARPENLPFSLVRLTDVAPALSSAAPASASGTSVAPAATATAPAAEAAVNPANVSSPRRRRPPVSGF